MNATTKSESASYPLPFRVSLAEVLELSRRFQCGHKGKTRRLALRGALFDSIALYFHLFAKVNRSRLQRRAEHNREAMDLECVDDRGAVVIALQLDNECVTIAKVQGTIIESRHRAICDVFFTAPKVEASDADPINTRIAGSGLL
jgi:hypothetical protein